jgi:hypothetical protein
MSPVALEVGLGLVVLLLVHRCEPELVQRGRDPRMHLAVDALLHREGLAQQDEGLVVALLGEQRARDHRLGRRGFLDGLSRTTRKMSSACR